MRKIIGLFLLLTIGLCVPVRAATPLKSYMELKDGRHIYTKTFEASPDEDSSLLQEKPFKQDGFSYSYYETAKEEVTAVEKRIETNTSTVRTDNDSIQEIARLFAPELDYSDGNGFTGKLLLVQDSIKTEVEGYKQQSFTLTDTVTLMGLSSNDSANIPKSRTRSGVTLTLKDIDWTAQETAAYGYEVIPTKYTAVAHYSGSYTKSVPTGYISTVEYSGEVQKTWVEKVIYTLTYIGTELPKPTPSPTLKPMPTSSPEPEEQGETDSPAGWIAGLIIGLSVIGGAVAALFIFYFNTSAYIKNGDEYRLIARKHLAWKNPLVDLNGLDVAGKEVAVNVKKRVAERLFGRYIKTVAGGFAIRCMVDKQNGDFWYLVDIPPDGADAGREEREDASESEAPTDAPE